MIVMERILDPIKYSTSRNRASCGNFTSSAYFPFLIADSSGPTNQGVWVVCVLAYNTCWFDAAR